MKNLRILPKMLLGIILPVVLLLSLASAVIIYTVDQSVANVALRSLSSESKAVANQTREFFNTYVEIAKQAATNYEVENLLKNTQKGTRISNTLEWQNIRRTLQNVVKTDEQNILSSWVCDFDSSQYAQHDGASSNADWDVTTRPLYEVTKTKAPLLTEPYVDSASSNMIVSMVAPVFDSSSNEIIGATAVDIKLNQLNAILSKYKIGESGFIVLCTDSGQVVYSPNKDDIQKAVADTALSKNAVEAIQNKKLGTLEYTLNGKKVTGELASVGNTGWMILTGLPQEELEAASKAVAGTIFAIMGILLPLLALITIFIARGIVKPLKKLSVASNRIADGDLDVTVETKSSDEVGQVSAAIGKTVLRLKEYINYIDEVSQVLNKIAQGNLRYELSYDYQGEFAKIKDSLLNIQTTLSTTFSDILQSADQVAGGSEQVSGGAQGLSQSTTEQAATIQELSATISEISQNVNKNAKDSDTANKLTSEASRKLIAGNEEMKKMLSAMEDISAASKKIEKIIKAIDDIAFQTNILALNAAVEAARAGAAGKGFAVVADEVRNLASKSAQAAKDTTQLIQDAITAVENGTKIANKTAETLVEVIEGSEQAAKIVSEISQSTADQAKSIDQMTQGIDQISSVIQNNAATAEESAATSEELSAQAETLQRTVRQFQI
ncbi:methyl-accepting chemotaxis protein [Acetanaerobacterium elongatum]|uniref:Methyl-accepting chemotaxis sensory transducer with Cache sensor n=1 Tax=Acetanaerobacterium elongatum TaxID=258515 RepID=A0A1G9Y502_9FIRM|nr:methyl-accepting chemotaxis protein [Acetanaerobacterium elongatum]SDN03545.1 methyl-accepting chemotaxis sensory transducer with Cache sensor [Acetanaerobacterium elongatum]